MPTEKCLGAIPPFPADAPVANLPTISLQKLQAADPAEAQRLFSACRVHGFMMLDLRGTQHGEALLKDAENMFELTTETMELGKEVLDRYAYNAPKSLMGYKSAGRLKTDDGKLDAMEMYSLGQDDALGVLSASSNPAPVEARRPDCRHFFTHAHAAVRDLLNALDTQLALPAGTLASLCPQDRPSATCLRMLLSRPGERVDEGDDTNRRITLGGHTDIGTITLLFHQAGGLQILPPGATASDNAAWRFVQPKLGCALVNLGDTIVEWTGGLLRSCLHRVVTPPGEQANVPRLSLAYPVRPARDCDMRRLKGPGVIPELTEGEKDDNRNVDDWATERGAQIMRGELRAQTIGGAPTAGVAVGVGA